VNAGKAQTIATEGRAPPPVCIRDVRIRASRCEPIIAIMSRRFQFRLATLFWLTLWSAVLCMVGPPAWTWAKANLFPPQWREVGGPGAIQAYTNTYSNCFQRSRIYSDKASAWRLASRLDSMRSRRSPARIARVSPRRQSHERSANVAISNGVP
jgi:hypothetical protein